MSNADLLTTEFVLTLPNGTALRVQVLPIDGEAAILKELGKRLFASYGPGGYFQQCAASLDYMLKNNMTVAYQTAVKELTHLTATKTKPGWDAIQDFRQTPEGVACELWLRTRKTHPDLPEAMIQAIVTEANVWQLANDLQTGLNEDHKRRSAGADAIPA